MNCDRADLLIGVLFGGADEDELDPAERAEAEVHLAACASCRATLEAHRRLIRSLDELPAERPGDEARERNRAAVLAAMRVQAANASVGAPAADALAAASSGESRSPAASAGSPGAAGAAGPERAGQLLRLPRRRRHAAILQLVAAAAGLLLVVALALPERRPGEGLARSAPRSAAVERAASAPAPPASAGRDAPAPPAPAAPGAPAPSEPPSPPSVRLPASETEPPVAAERPGGAPPKAPPSGGEPTGGQPSAEGARPAAPTTAAEPQAPREASTPPRAPAPGGPASEPARRPEQPKAGGGAGSAAGGRAAGSDGGATGQPGAAGEEARPRPPSAPPGAPPSTGSEDPAGALGAPDRGPRAEADPARAPASAWAVDLEGGPVVVLLRAQDGELLAEVAVADAALARALREERAGEGGDGGALRPQRARDRERAAPAPRPLDATRRAGLDRLAAAPGDDARIEPALVAVLGLEAGAAPAARDAAWGRRVAALLRALGVHARPDDGPDRLLRRARTVLDR